MKDSADEDSASVPSVKDDMLPSLKTLQARIQLAALPSYTRLLCDQVKTL
jgi:hypothetical protein